MAKGVRAIMVPDLETIVDGDNSITEKVKKVIKKERRKYDRGKQPLEMLSEAMVLSTISQSQQQILTTLKPPTVAGKVIDSVDTALWPGVNQSNAELLRWAVNGVASLGAATYNAISALRAETLIAFLDTVTDPRGKRGGLFGGGVAGLLILSSFGGGMGLGSIFGGGGIVRDAAVFGGVS